MILDASHTPVFDEISEYIDEPAKTLWQDINSFIQTQYKAAPKLTYSKCSAKPGWNVKYHKAGKSLCTLYPEKTGFVALVVITLDLVPLIEAMSGELEAELLDIIKSAKPLNGTLWLMIPVAERAVLDNVKRLIMLKQQTKRNAKSY